MQTFYMTDAGKVRTHNEDNVIILNNNNNEFILAVADGMAVSDASCGENEEVYNGRNGDFQSRLYVLESEDESDEKI